MNLLFDECLPPRWCRLLARILRKRKVPISASHMLMHLKQGATDDVLVEWVLKQQPPMMVISADSGARSKRGDPRLPTLCPQRGITSVFVARKLCQQEGFEKFRMMIVCIPALEAAYQGTRGLRYRLETHGEAYHIRAWPLAIGAPSPTVARPPS